jgi:hypothetical protein
VAISVTRSPFTPLGTRGRLIAPGIALLAVASLFGVSRAVEHATRRGIDRVAVSAGDTSSHPALLVGRTKLTAPRAVGTKPSREWRLTIDALLVSAALALAADLSHRSFDARRRDQRRVDSIFARRRGPPLVDVVL